MTIPHHIAHTQEHNDTDAPPSSGRPASGKGRRAVLHPFNATAFRDGCRVRGWGTARAAKEIGCAETTVIRLQGDDCPGASLRTIAAIAAAFDRNPVSASLIALLAE